MITLIVEALFAVVFVRAVAAYLRSRDPLERDVMLVFSSLAVLFVLELLGRFGGPPPAAVELGAIALLLLQPYFTLRLVSRVRAVPRWLLATTLALCLGTALPVLIQLSGPSPVVLMAAVATFVVTELLSAAFLAVEARRRAGSPRFRLTAAAVATALFAAAILAAGAEAGALPQYVALGSAIGYLIAFLPPAWLRRWWSAEAAYSVSRRLLRTPVQEAPEDTWRRYAEMMGEIAGADGAVVLLGAPSGAVQEAARSRVPAGPAIDHDRDELTRLSAAARAVTTTDRRARTMPGLARPYAERTGAPFVVVVPLRIPPENHGVLILLNRHRRLFSDDDLGLLGELGTQAGVLAEQARLTAELSASVAALTIASNAKSDFLAGVSHELRTPLNAIIGFSELMRTAEAANEERLVPAEWIEHIYSSGHRLLGLIDDILDLAKVESGRIELRREHLSLPNVIADAVAALRPLVDRKHLRITTDVPALSVLADRTRFGQILDNLLSNAIKFTPERGGIHLSAGRDGGEVRITVADTGPGIAKADQERVFEEFQQAGDVDSRKLGTGLGLALTRRLVHAHGGRITLASELGRGAVFNVYLPTTEPGERLAATVAELPGRRGGILLIEDDPGAVRLLRMYLEEAGYPVTVATNGEDGLVAARELAPDAILLDVLLPGVDGWEVLRELKRDEQVRDIPVVIVTVVDEQEVGLALGAVDYFVKPIDRESLLDRLARHDIHPSRDTATTVLAIDDDRATLDLVEVNLRQEGFGVVTAASGIEGIRLAGNQHFDLVICDLLMPGVDGFAVISALCADAATRDTPILVLTAHDLTERDKARLNGRILGIMRKGDAVQAELRDWLQRLTAPARDITVAGRSKQAR